MKQLSDKFLAVEVLPNHEYDVNNLRNPQLLYIHKNEQLVNYIQLPPGDWELFTDSETITEDQAAKIVIQNKISGRYHDYVKANLSVGKYGACFLDTALESLSTLYASLGIHFVNPMGDKPKRKYVDYLINRVPDKAAAAWQTAQQSVVEKLIILRRK